MTTSQSFFEIASQLAWAEDHFRNPAAGFDADRAGLLVAALACARAVMQELGELSATDVTSAPSVEQSRAA